MKYPPEIYKTQDLSRKAQAVKDGFTQLVSTNGYVYYVFVSRIILGSTLTLMDGHRCSLCKGYTGVGHLQDTNFVHYLKHTPGCTTCPVCWGKPI